MFYLTTWCPQNSRFWVNLGWLVKNDSLPGSGRHVPGRKFRKRDMAYRNSWWVGKKWIEMKSNAWNEWSDMNDLKWRNWNEWLETHELTWMNWNKWIEPNEWNKWIQVNELTWMNWTEWTETNELREMICRPHLEKVVRTRQFFAVLMWNRALATVSCTFCRPHLQKVARPRQFSIIFMWSTTWWRCCRLSLQSRARFVDLMVDLILKKCSEPNVSVFYDFYVKSSSHYSLEHILSTTFRIEARTCGNRDPPAATTDGHSTRKKTGSCARECFQLDDYVIDMMMWLRGDWDDDVVAMMVRQLAIGNRPYLGSFLTKLPLIKA